MKKKLQLSTLIKVQKFLEDLILTQEKYITDYNDTEMNVISSLDSVVEAESELVKVKEAIQTANDSKHSDGKTNRYYIFYLSNLKMRKIFLQNVKTTEKSQLTQEKIAEQIAEIDKKINEIKSKLTEFNTKEISIELNETIVTIL